MPKKIKTKRKNKKKQQRILFISIAFLISLISLILIITNFRNNIVFFYSPSELQEVNVINKVIRVGGLVKEGTVSQKDGILKFTITDNKEDLVINYQGIKPNLFREGQGMVAKGKFDNNQDVFIAKELLAKHDENYMPPEVKKSLKE